MTIHNQTRTFIRGSIDARSMSKWDYEDFNRVLEQVINEVCENPGLYRTVEYRFKMLKDDSSSWMTNVERGTDRWTVVAKNPLASKSREGQRLLFYNIKTKFWMLIHNHNTPDVFKKFLKDTPGLFTHIISLDLYSMNDDELSGLVSRLERSEKIKEVKSTISKLKVIVGIEALDETLATRSE